MKYRLCLLLIMCSMILSYIYTYDLTPILTGLGEMDPCPGEFSYLNNPGGMAFNSKGDLFVVSYGEKVIKKVSSDRKTITKVAFSGYSGTATIDAPIFEASIKDVKFLCVGPSDDLLYVFYDDKLVLANFTAGYMKVISRDIFFPQSRTLGPDGFVYFSQETCIRKIDVYNNHIITTIAGDCGNGAFTADGNVASSSKIEGTFGIGFWNNTLYFTDEYSCIRKIVDGKLWTVAGVCGSSGTNDGIGASAAFNNIKQGAMSVSLDNDMMFVYDSRVLRSVNLTSTEVKTIIGTNSYNPFAYNSNPLLMEANGLNYMAVNSSNTLFINFNDAHAVFEYSLHDNVVRVAVGKLSLAGLEFPVQCTSIINFGGVKSTSNGDIYYIEKNINTINKISKGKVSVVIGGGSDSTSTDPLTRKLTPQLEKIALNPLNESELYFIQDTYTSLTKYVIGSNYIEQITPSTSLSYNNGLPMLSTIFGVGVKIRINPFTNEMYTIETNQNLVRKVNASGPVNVFIGGGLTQSVGVYRLDYDAQGIVDIGFLSNGAVLFCDGSQNIRMVHNETGVIMHYSTLTIPTNFVIKAFTVYNDTVYYITNSYGKIYRTSGTPSQIIITGGSYGPCNAAFSNANLIVVLDTIYYTCSNIIFKVPITGGARTAVAGGGGTIDDGMSPTSAKVDGCNWLKMYNGELFFESSENKIIYKINSSNVIETVVGKRSVFEGPREGPRSAVRIGDVSGFDIDSAGQLFVAQDTKIREILKVNFISGTVTKYAGGRGDGAPYQQAMFDTLSGIDFLSDGSLVLVEKDLGIIRKIDKTTGIVSTIAGVPYSADHSQTETIAKKGSIFNPKSVFVDRSTDTIYFSSTYSGQVSRVFSNGTLQYNFVSSSRTSSDIGFYGDYGLAIDAKLNDPSDIVMNSKGEMFIADSGNNRIRKVFSNGTIVTVAGNGAGSFKPIFNTITDATQIHFASLQYISLYNENIVIAEQNPNDIGRLFKLEYNCTNDGVCPFYCFNISMNSPQVCSRHGACIASDICNCSSGYYEIDCSDFSCFGVDRHNSSVCSGNGQCIDYNQCNCSQNYYGDDCGDFSCFGFDRHNSSSCSGNGQCIDYNQCDCDPGYYGNDCSDFSCYNIDRHNSSVCSGNGNCIDYNQCNCSQGYYGDDCSDFSCFGIDRHNSTVCHGKGNCTNINQCKCSQGYFGDDCGDFSCFNIDRHNTTVCSGNGNCIDYNQCNCSQGYYESDCSDFSCFGFDRHNSSVCSGNGQCINYNQCNCSQGYYESDCSDFSCFSIDRHNSSVCSGNGNCSSYNVCKCKEGYYESDCSDFSCFNIDRHNSSVCSGNGQCINYNQCNCSQGYYESDCSDFSCFGVDRHNSSVCSGNGQCVGYNQCKCSQGYYEDDCSDFACFGIDRHNSTVCSGFGNCTDVNQCKCMSGHFGLQCESTVSISCFGIESTNQSVCSSHGQCIRQDNCSCTQGYYENDCSDFSCFGVDRHNSSSCSGNGQCVDYNQCKCSQGYYESDCSDFSCFGFDRHNSSSCSGNGQCIDYNQCNCDPGYYGNDCSDFSCFGIDRHNSSACSGNGNCINYNQCNCSQGYYESDCSDFSCFGIDRHNSSVCSGNGQCVGYNQCKCSQGYYEDDCSDFACFGIDRHNSTVCSGFGNCTDVNQCKCMSGHFGLQCESTVSISCFGIESTNQSVCSSHGQCVSYNQCNCSTGYIGNDCSDFSCFGIDRHDSAACSSNGKCVNMDSCDCFSSSSQGFWTGSSCGLCQQGLYGEECKTSFSNVKFSDEGTSILLEVTTSQEFNTEKSIDCKKLLVSSAGLGEGTMCVAKLVNNSKMIEIQLGYDSTIMYEDSIYINTNVFDKKDSVNSLTLVARRANQPVPPSTVFSQSKSQFGSCENIIIDASQSSCVDRRKLSFDWSMISGPSDLSAYFQNSPLLLIDYEYVISGSYSIKLKTTSSLSQKTDEKTLTFTKLGYSLPIITIQGKQDITTSLSDVPLFIKKKIEYPSCFPSNSVVSNIWTQTSGVSLKYQIDSTNNLIITEFLSKNSETYEFMLNSTFESTSIINTVKITTQLPDMTCQLFISDRDSSSLTLLLEHSDPIIETESYSWNCTDESGMLCPAYVMQQINTATLNKTVLISLSETQSKQFVFSATVKKGNRITLCSKTVQIVPPTQTVPPTINLISIEPNNKLINYGQIVSIQNEVIPANTECYWTVNSKPLINGSMSSLMRNLGQSELLIDSTYLDFGETYKFVITATQKNVSASAEYSLTVDVPPKCFCAFYPLSGVAMMTDFTYYCINCQHGDINYGFVDDKSGALIPLYMMGAKFSSKLPLPFKGNTLEVYAQIVSKSSGAASIVKQNITIIAPTVKNDTEFANLIKLWTDKSNSIGTDDLCGAIYNAATISRTSIVMNQNLKKRAISSICYNGGTFNSEKNACDCANGYYRKDCSETLQKFQQNQQNHLTLLNTFVQTFFKRNALELMNWAEFSHELYGIDSLMTDYDLLNYSGLNITLKYMETLLETAIASNKLVFPSNTFSFVKNSLNSIFSHMRMKEITNYKSEERRLYKMIDKILILVMREHFVGMVDYQSTQIEFSSMMSNLYRKIHLSNGVDIKFQVDGQSSLQTIPKEVSKMNALSTSKLSQVQFNMYSIPNRVFNTKFDTVNTIKEQNNVKIEESTSNDYLSKNAINFNFVNNPISKLNEPFKMEILLTRIVKSFDLIPNKLISENSTVKTYESRSLQCKLLSESEDKWNSDPCTIEIIDNSDRAICNCLQSGIVTITEQVTTRREISTIITPRQSEESSNDLKYLAFLTLIIPVMVIGCCVIVIIVICYRRRNKKDEEKEEQHASVQLREVV